MWAPQLKFIPFTLCARNSCLEGKHTCTCAQSLGVTTPVEISSEWAVMHCHSAHLRLVAVSGLLLDVQALQKVNNLEHEEAAIRDLALAACLMPTVNS